MFRSSLTAFGAVIILLILPACSGPLSMLEPAGPGAHEAAMLWWGTFGFFTLVYLAVVAAWLCALARRSSAPDPELDKVHPPDGIARHRLHQALIIGGGVVLPVIAMIALLVPGIPAGNRMTGTHITNEAALHIDVTGHQWWWEVVYPSAESGLEITLRNEVHIPVDTPIRLTLHSADVIHSFWVPRLGPKVDLIPGRANQLFLQADEPGVYAGVCAEFCGLAHAHMTFELHAYSADDFASWLEAQQTSSAEANR